MRALGLPRPLAARADDLGYPLELWRIEAGRRTALGRVLQIEEVWRLADEWWRATDPPSPPGERGLGGEGLRGLARTYFRVILDDGRPLTLFHDDAHDPRARRKDGTCEGWYEQHY